MPLAKALVNPRMLRWSREKAGYTVSEVAARLDRSQTDIRGWEQGGNDARRPSISQARKLAGLYRRTLGWFYLAEPPEEASFPPDYRRSSAGTPPTDLSPALRQRIRELHALREAALDLAEDDPSAFPDFPIKATLSMPPSVLADKLRRALAIPIAKQISWNSTTTAFSRWRSAIENQMTCLVFVLDRLGPEELDGLSLGFDRAPVIALNGNSRLSHGRRVFTLLHELAHVALRSEGVCNLADNAARSEAFCNQTAASVLMPDEAMTEAALKVRPSHSRNADWSEAQLKDLATSFSVSLQAVFVRLVTLGFARQEQYDEWVRNRQRDWVEPSPGEKREGGPSFYNLYLHRMSSPYLRRVFDSYHDERISLDELSDYLGVKPNTALTLDQHFRKRQNKGHAS